MRYRVAHARIKQRREELRLSQAEAAVRAGMTGPQQWANIESGARANVRSDTLHRIAGALGLRMDDLMVLDDTGRAKP